jgi:hypothetical protein
MAKLCVRHNRRDRQGTGSSPDRASLQDEQENTSTAWRPRPGGLPRFVQTGSGAESIPDRAVGADLYECELTAPIGDPDPAVAAGFRIFVEGEASR